MARLGGRVRRKSHPDRYAAMGKIRDSVKIPPGTIKAGAALRHFGAQYYLFSSLPKSSPVRRLRCVKCNKRGYSPYNLYLAGGNSGVSKGPRLIHLSCFCAYVLKLQAHAAQRARRSHERVWEGHDFTGKTCPCSLWKPAELITPAEQPKPLKKGEKDHRVWKEQRPPYLLYAGSHFREAQRYQGEKTPVGYPQHPLFDGYIQPPYIEIEE